VQKKALTLPHKNTKILAKRKDFRFQQGCPTKNPSKRQGGFGCETDVYSLFFGLDNVLIGSESEPISAELSAISKADATKRRSLQVLH
jgi:hypothetical protein